MNILDTVKGGYTTMFSYAAGEPIRVLQYFECVCNYASPFIRVVIVSGILLCNYVPSIKRLHK